MKRKRDLFLLLVAIPLLLAGLQVATWYYRANSAEVNRDIVSREYPVVSDGLHNSNTDLIRWKNSYILAHASSPFHMGSDSSVVHLKISKDLIRWEDLHTVKIPESDIRDPKLAVIGGELFLYFLRNDGFEPAPSGTYYIKSMGNDLDQWTNVQQVEPKGWLLWRPRTLDEKTYYTTAYWHEHGKSVLLRSANGIQWEIVSEIYSGDRNDETAMLLRPDGTILVTARLEGDRSWHQGAFDARTLIASASPPYQEWHREFDNSVRLDGPALFLLEGIPYAVGRFDPEGNKEWYGMSSLLGRKRTSVYRVEPGRLVRLTDLPSGGDTAYPGVVITEDEVVISYYSNRTDRDFAWLLGLVLPTDIYIAILNREELTRAGEIGKD